MTMFFPNPRYRMYGAARKYSSLGADAAAGRIDDGDAIERLERAVDEFIGVPHAIAMPQARVALLAALQVLLRDRKKVVLSPYTIHDVINMVICAGGEPVFVDVRDDCNIDPDGVARVLTADVGAVLITHLHGLACDVERIVAMCRPLSIPVIEDCAQAFGAEVRGRRLGSFGTVGVFSFGMAKNLNSFYGGMAVTPDAALAAAIRQQISEWPYFAHAQLLNRAAFCLTGDILTTRPVFWSATYWLFRLGYLRNIDALNNRWRGELDPQLKRAVPESYLRRMTPAQARVILTQLPGVDEHAATRRQWARIYHEGLSGIPEIILPPWRDDGSHVYLTYPIQVPDRDALNRHLMQHCQDITIQHLINTADADCYRPWHRDCPNARRIQHAVLLLPTYPAYGARNATRNVELIRQYFAGQR